MDFSAGLKRIPPQSLDAEQGVLGCCMFDGTPRAVEISRDLLVEEDFYLGQNRYVFTAICRLNDRDEPTDLIPVADELLRMGAYDAAGGRAYLAACVEAVPYGGRAEHYCRMVKEAALRRRLIDAGGAIIGEAYDHDGPAADVLAFAEGKVCGLHDPRRERGFTRAARIASDEYQRITDAHAAGKQFTGVETGIRALDVLTGGLQPADLILIGGRPSMGKTAVGLRLGVTAAKGGVPVGIFSLEMSKAALMLRVLSAETLIDTSRLRNGQLFDREWSALQNAVAASDEWPLYIDDGAELTLPAARSRARRLKMEHGLGLIVVDYVQLMAQDGASKLELRHEIGRLAKGFKDLGRELSVPVIMLSQVSRDCERRDDKRPRLSDLAESGALEQAADVVIFPFRPHYYAEGATPDAEGLQPMELIVAKHRNGETDTIHVGFNKTFGFLRDQLPEVPPEREIWQ